MMPGLQHSSFARVQRVCEAVDRHCSFDSRCWLQSTKWQDSLPRSDAAAPKQIVGNIAAAIADGADSENADESLATAAPAAFHSNRGGPT
jgi:hypothetical protein